MKYKFTFIALIILFIISISQTYAAEEITITYPINGAHYIDISKFNGTLTAGDTQIIENSVQYKLNCTDDFNESYFFDSSNDGDWNLPIVWNDVSYSTLEPDGSTTWNATETEIPSSFIEGSCILTMKAWAEDQDPFYSDDITFTFNPDLIDITYSSPENDSWSNNNTQGFTFVAINNFYSTMSCELIIESESFGINSSVLNNTETTITPNQSISEFEGINNAWYIECIDEANNIEAPDEWLINFDYSEPQINLLNSPDNNLNTSNTTINFNWTITDNEWDIGDNVSDDNLTTTLSCDLNINGAINATISGSESNITNYTSSFNYPISNIGNGVYYWNITCTDNANNSNTTETKYFTIDSVEPIITPIYPANNEYINQLNLNFSVNATGSTLKRATISIDGVNESYNPDSTPPLTSITCNQVNDTELYYCNITTTLSNGTHQANITAWDYMDNNVTYLSLNFTVDTTDPVVSIINSSFSTTDLTPSITFNYSDVVVTSANCSLYFDGVSVANNATVVNNTNTIFTASSQTTNTNYTVYVNCTDLAGNIGQSSSIYVDIDSTAPTISNMNASTTSSTYTITGTANGTGSSVVNITFDNTSLTINSSEIVNFSVQKSLSVGNNIYNITIVDAAGNEYNSTVKIIRTQATTTTTSSSSSSSSSDNDHASISSYWISTYIVNDDDFEVGYSKSLAGKKRFKVTVENITHYVGLVNLTNTTATINVSSDTQQKIFNIGDIYKFEVTNDSYYDIKVKLNSILNNEANITTTLIHEKVVIEEDQTIISIEENITATIDEEDTNLTEENNESILPVTSDGKEKSINNYILALIIIVVIIVIVILIRNRAKNRRF